jgi:hypothetical protein
MPTVSSIIVELRRACLDWSERRSHVAGAFGAVLADWLMTQEWLCRVPNSRALRLTEAGRAGFAREWYFRFHLLFFFRSASEKRTTKRR